MQPSISVRALEKLLGWASDAGIERGALLAGAGVEARLLEDREARVPLVALHRLWGDVLAASGRRDAPLEVARRYAVADYALVGFLCQHSATLGQALGKLARFSGLWVDEPRFTVDGARLTLVYRAPFAPGPGLWCATEASFAEVLHAAELAAPGQAPPRRVAFAHPAPADPAPFTAHFGVPVEFDAPVHELVLAPGALEAPLGRADPELAGFLESLAATALARHAGEDTLRGRVMTLLAARLREGVSSAAPIARELGMSERTLRRRLEEEGTGFRELIDATRAELAREYIRDRRLPLAEVAWLLGFSEVSAFHRAFKRWTGETPAGFRGRRA